MATGDEEPEPEWFARKLSLSSGESESKRFSIRFMAAGLSL